MPAVLKLFWSMSSAVSCCKGLWNGSTRSPGSHSFQGACGLASIHQKLKQAPGGACKAPKCGNSEDNNCQLTSVTHNHTLEDCFCMLGSPAESCVRLLATPGASCSFWWVEANLWTPQKWHDPGDLFAPFSLLTLHGVISDPSGWGAPVWEPLYYILPYFPSGTLWFFPPLILLSQQSYEVGLDSGPKSSIGLSESLTWII